MQSNEHTIDSAQLGGFWLRAIAYVVDSLILLVPNLIIAQGSQELFGPEMGPIWGVLMTGFFGFFYFGLLQSQMEGSFGKKMLGLTLVSTSFEKLTLRQTIVRFLMGRVSGLALGIGYFSVAWDPQKRSWHDKVAGTRVLRADYVRAQRATRAASVTPLRALPPAPTSDQRAA